jgi:hypothetical protein
MTAPPECSPRRQRGDRSSGPALFAAWLVLIAGTGLTGCELATPDWVSRSPLPAAGQLSAAWRLSGPPGAGNDAAPNSAAWSSIGVPEEDQDSAELPPLATGPGALPESTGVGTVSLSFGVALELELLLVWPQDGRPAALDLKPWEPAAPRELSSDLAERDGFKLERRRLRLRPTQLGELRLPSLEFALRDGTAPALWVPGPALSVQSALPEEPASPPAMESAFEPLDDLPGLPSNFLHKLFPWLPGLLLLLWWRRRRRPASNAPAPWQALAAQLNALAPGAEGLAPDQARARAQQLVQLLRRYLVQTRGWPAEQRTTTELIGLTREDPQAHSALASALLAADERRFGHPESTNATLLTALNAAQLFVAAEAATADNHGAAGQKVSQAAATDPQAPASSGGPIAALAESSAGSPDRIGGAASPRSPAPPPDQSSGSRP